MVPRAGAGGTAVAEDGRADRRTRAGDTGGGDEERTGTRRSASMSQDKLWEKKCQQHAQTLRKE